jgi:beta-lactamase class A
MWKKYAEIFPVIVALLMGMALMWFLKPNIADEQKQLNIESSAVGCEEQYPLLNPHTNCALSEKISDQIESLRERVEKIIVDEKAVNHVTRVSVFYRDLETKRWFGIDDELEYYPGSLVKLPLAMGYYKLAELQPEILNKQLTIPESDTVKDNTDQYYPPFDPLRANTVYTVAEMIRHMVVYSDNAPFEPLLSFGNAFIPKALNDLGIKTSPQKNGDVNWVASVRTYGGALRALYNASYLGIENSNFLLGLLSQSTFKNGITAGVPSEIRVAHKYGEGTGVNEAGDLVTYTLNDCGIVYKPAQPYILCVMTEGREFKQMEQVIQGISRAIYNNL